MSYEELLEKADAAERVVKEKPLLNNGGDIKGDVLKYKEHLKELIKLRLK